MASAPPIRGRLGRSEMLWGYLFVAAPLIGFLLFGAIPLVGSLVLGFTEWDLAGAPEFVGMENWSDILSLHVTTLPAELDEATGERMFRCGRERVIESQVAEFRTQTDPITREPYVCQPRYARPGTVLPDGFQEWMQFSLFGNRILLGAVDPIFWIAMANTFFLLLCIPISLVIALGLAIAMNQNIVGARFFRTIYYTPVILPIAALALIWLWIFNPDYGLLNYFLGRIGLPSDIDWLGNPYTVKPALMIMLIWRGLGYQVLIYLAGLQSVPRQLHEAAQIDGANGWQRFRAVTWPALTPTTFFLLITSMIGTFQIFQEPFLMTEGEPYFQSTTMVMVIQQNAFRDTQMGYASAQAWLLGLIIIVFTLLNFAISRRWVSYES
ncbi:MAG: sugar ABC transporter permease [bacterium]|nr:sugar ABC transporter permease [bacterium]